MTVKVPGKRPPRAVAPAGPSPVPPAALPGVNGLSKEPAAADGSSTGTPPVESADNQNLKQTPQP